jgi:hypothetical protein
LCEPVIEIKKNLYKEGSLEENKQNLDVNDCQMFELGIEIKKNLFNGSLEKPKKII